MKEPELDDYCYRIFAFLAANTTPLRFTRLYRELNTKGFKVSKPTLATHLDHLQKHEIITRETKGKQNVSYSVNWNKLNYLKPYPTYRKALRKIRTERRIFDSFAIDEKVGYVTLLLSLLQTMRLKSEIRCFLEPKRRFEANITYLFAQSTLEPFRIWLLQDCLKSKDDAQEALAKVEELEQRIQNELFEKKR